MCMCFAYYVEIMVMVVKTFGDSPVFIKTSRSLDLMVKVMRLNKLFLVHLLLTYFDAEF